MEYILRETVAPEGYAVTTDTTFSMDEKGVVTTTGTSTTDEDGNTVLLVEDAKTSVSVSKRDITTGEELEGAHIQIIDSRNNVVAEWISEAGITHVVEGLTAGRQYTLHEETAPAGYLVSSDNHFKIETDGSITPLGNSTTDEEGNTILLIEDEKTSFSISKVDLGNGEELEGAHIQIIELVTDEETGETTEVIVEEWDSTLEAHEIIGLTVGTTYILRETTAPEGYDTTVDTSFVLEDDGEGHTYIDRDKTTSTVKESADDVILVEDWKEGEAASLTVTKHVELEYHTDDGTDYLPLTGDDVFYVALFQDDSLTKMYPGSIKAIEFSGTDSASVTYDKLIPGATYYIAEVDAEGNVVQGGDLLAPVYVHIAEDGSKTESQDPIEITTEAASESEATVKNRYLTHIPDGFYIDGRLSLNKILLTADGEVSTEEGVFYAGIFLDEDFTILANANEETEGAYVSRDVVALNGNGDSVDVAVYLSENRQECTLYITETDAEGKPVGEGFGYEMSVENGAVIMSLPDSLTAKTTITNTELSEEPVSETATLVLTKKIEFLPDEETAEAMGIELASYDFYVRIFKDAALTVPYENKLYTIPVRNASSAKVTITVPAGETYYLAEVDQKGNPISEAEIFMPQFGEEESRTQEFNFEPASQNEVLLVNMFTELPEGPGMDASMSVTKKVLGSDGKEKNSSETFYAGVFLDAGHTRLATANDVANPVMTLSMGGKSSVTVANTIHLTQEKLDAGLTFYVTETDRNGKPVGSDFGYTVTVSNNGVVKAEASTRVEIVITNTEKATATATPTITVTPAVTVIPTPVSRNITSAPASGYTVQTSNGGNSGTTSNTSTTTNSGGSYTTNTAQTYTENVTTASVARTVDETPISLYLLLLALAAGTMLILLMKKRQR